jgi:hypothetical protein
MYDLWAHLPEKSKLLEILFITLLRKKVKSKFPEETLFTFSPRLPQAKYDPTLESVISWVKENGGTVNAEPRVNGGLRGLYATGSDTTILSIPHKLIISSEHISGHIFNKGEK